MLLLLLLGRRGLYWSTSIYLKGDPYLWRDLGERLFFLLFVFFFLPPSPTQKKTATKKQCKCDVSPSGSSSSSARQLSLVTIWKTRVRRSVRIKSPRTTLLQWNNLPFIKILRMITILWLYMDQCHYMARWKSFSPRFQGRLMCITWSLHGWYMSLKIIANQRVRKRSAKALQSESKLITFTRWTTTTTLEPTLHLIFSDSPLNIFKV